MRNARYRIANGGFQALPYAHPSDGNSLWKIFDVRMRLIGNMLIPG